MVNENHPLVLGFVGGSATGKTVTADALSPPARFQRPNDLIFWDHLSFALPMKRMATVRQNIEGFRAYDRMCYEIHATLLDIFGYNPLYGAPPYDDLVQMVYQIMETPCKMEGKPRSFLQQVGTDICRAYDSDVWVKWMGRKIREGYYDFVQQKEREAERDEDYSYMPRYYGVVVSDCRFRNEAQLVYKQPNGILLRLTARPEVVRQRQLDRDGYSMLPEEQEHISENSLDNIPKEWYDDIIDTSDMTVQEQLERVKSVVTSKIYEESLRAEN